ncbi:60S acidic ribosomal protein P2 [Microplitis mediator]|uniref:60S acidic ribosomal protein P2 n=1 Tax=Microplitis mediator TaxID=375433 RepID=UPI002552BEDA|nr:60S acidic ribosomal protein P2 [Microplitis mediator]
MRYVAAYLLAVLGGKAAPSQNDIEKILSSVGIEADAEKLKKVITSLEGKSIEDLIAEGRTKLSSMPVGGGVAAAAAAPGAAAAAPAAEEKKEDKKAAKEDSESEDDDMGFGLFD